MMAILSAFAIGAAGLVSAVAAMNILIYSRVFLKEALSRQEISGLTAALVGIQFNTIAQKRIVSKKLSPRNNKALTRNS